MSRSTFRAALRLARTIRHGFRAARLCVISLCVISLCVISLCVISL
jgi:hypothetical protein